MGVSKKLRSFLLWIASFVQVGLAIAVVYFVNQASDVNVNVQDQTVEVVNCALDADDQGDRSLCNLAYTGVAITLLLFFALSIVLCISCNLCSQGWILEVAVNGFLCFGWIVYASWVTDAARKIDGWDTHPVWDSDDVQNARSNVVALSWAEAVLTGIVALTILVSSCCCDDD